MIRILVLQTLFTIFTTDNQLQRAYISKMTLAINRTNLRVKIPPILITSILITLILYYCR